MKTSVISGIVALLLLAGGLLYVQSGDFTKVAPSQTFSSRLLLVGKPFKGKTKDKTMGETLNQVAKALKDKTLEGEMVICYYGNPDTDHEIEVFAGINQNSVSSIPEGFEVKKIPAYKAVSVKVNTGDLFAPTPANVNKAIIEFAKEKGLTLDTVYIEKFISDQEVVNEIMLVE